MKLAQFAWNGRNRVGVVEGEYVYDTGERSLDRVLSDGTLGSMQGQAHATSGRRNGIPLSSVRLLSPVTSPEKIFCVAENYRSHVEESAGKVATKPYLFTKFRNTIIGPGDPIVIPKISHRADWEVELAVVIGKQGKHIAREQALDFVAGYCVSNDISFRDLQFPDGWPREPSRFGHNWVMGKGLDGAFPLGPWLVTRDEIPDPHDLGIYLSLNGEQRQGSSTSEMVFSVPTLIEYISSGITLRPGDVISTGTPQGVAAFTDQRFLKEGDVVEAKIDRIGILRNPVTHEG